jgi:uncharacterized protein DUF6678
METEDQKKDCERLHRYIVREQLVSHMNNTKWDKLRELMVELGNECPLYRVQCLRAPPAHGWDGDWYYHLPTYKSIEWLDIDPILRERRGQLLEDKKMDYTQRYVNLLKENHIPFSFEGEYIRIWGYQRLGQMIDFA